MAEFCLVLHRIIALHSFWKSLYHRSFHSNRIYHPSVAECSAPYWHYQCRPCDSWRPTSTLKDVIKAIVNIIDDGLGYPCTVRHDCFKEYIYIPFSSLLLTRTTKKENMITTIIAEGDPISFVSNKMS